MQSVSSAICRSLRMYTRGLREKMMMKMWKQEWQKIEGVVVVVVACDARG